MNIDSKFKSNPYNPLNCYIQEGDILNIMSTLGFDDFHISDINIYQRAFVHKSYTKLKDYEEYNCPSDCMDLFIKSYETIEFLGDSLLGMIVSAYLYERYAENFEIDEGFLTKIKIRLVCGEQLGYLSKQLGFDKFMIISNHIQENCEGRKNVHILEDIYEAFLGAIFLDTQNIDMVRKFVIWSIEEHVDIVDLIAHDNNYKDQILRYFQHNYKVHPTYKIDEIEPGRFHCKIYREDILVGEGYGHTKKKSEQDASKNALVIFHVI
jgi:ribonuclease III